MTNITNMSNKFNTILADPPWQYKSPNALIGNAGRGWQDGQAEKMTQINVEKQYPTLSIEQLCSMNIEDFSNKNCHLYLWTTNGFLVEAHEIAKSWGFKPKTLLTWVKTKKGDCCSPSMKCGYWYRSSTEHILFCVKGSLKLIGEKCRPTAYLEPRLPHSVKPDFFYKLIEEQSPGPYLEVFARKKRVGWSSWGNEIESDLEISID